MDRKKVVVFVVVVLAIILGVWYFGCFSCNVAGDVRGVSIATGGTKGTYYTVGRAIAKAVNKDRKLKVTAETGNASVANITAVADKEVDFGITQADIAYWAYSGERMFKDNSIKNIRAVCALYPEHLQLIVAKRANVTCFADLKGKRVGIGAHESGTAGNAEALFQQARITEDDIDAYFLDFATITTLFKHNRLDAGFVVAGCPTEPVVDLFTTSAEANGEAEVTLLNFDEEFLVKLQKAYPFMVPSIIPAGTYKGLPETRTPAIMSFIVTSEDADDEMVYAFLESLYKHISSVQRSHAKGKEVTLETATQGLTIPLHPAAEKFFRDKGIIR